MPDAQPLTDFTPGEMLSIQLDLQDIVLFDPLTGNPNSVRSGSRLRLHV